MYLEKVGLVLNAPITALILPDAHVEPNQSTARFSALGQFIVEEQPDYIINLGDFNTMKSFSHWDMNKRLLMEGRRYKEDMLAGREAVKALSEEMRKMNKSRRAFKKKQYKPKVVWCDGNHEEWALRYIEQHPEVEGMLDPFRDQGVAEYFDDVEYVPYRAYKMIEGVAFTHAPIAANRQAVSGKYAIARALELYDTSVIFGHTHRLETMAHYSHGSGFTRRALSCGCFWDGVPEYLVGAQTNFWNGAILVYLLGGGEFDYATVSSEYLTRRYGG